MTEYYPSRIVMNMTGEEVRRLRRQLGLTQAELAERVGVTANSVARWERDEMRVREPAARLLRLLAERGQTPPQRWTEPRVTRPLRGKDDMTLHEAIANVLRDRQGKRAHIVEIAEQIAHLGLYTREDGRAPDRQQVSARISSYPDLFRRLGGGVIALVD